MVNAGSILASTVRVRANAFENSGQIIARRESTDPINGTVHITGGPITVETVSGKLDGGQFTALQDIRFGAGDLKFRNHTNTVGGALFLTVTNALTDNGPDARNFWQVSNGFNLIRKPTWGDLLGTRILSAVPTALNNVRHLWAGQDLGTNIAGFSNNVAIGHLVLDSPNGGKLSFAGTGTANALYVDYLELRGAALTNLAQTLSMARNFILYFGNSNLPVEELDGLFPDAQQPLGRVRWVPDYAGPRSGMDVLLKDGRVLHVNRALRFSKTIDSDGDGVTNYYDDWPFDVRFWNNVITTTEGDVRHVTLSWFAVPGTVYEVESTTNLASPNWVPVTTYTNLSLTTGTLTITDRTAPAGEAQRYYRIRYKP
jgi:hypothetical protein